MRVLMPYLQFLRDTLHLHAKSWALKTSIQTLTTLPYLSNAKKRKFIVGLSMMMVENCTIIGDAILGNNVEESGDKKYDHVWTLCHYAALAL